ncbi:hypothetical protein HN011_006180 [Eciton burchellii]|nr:hypothetical protein HN011_006180 [Eciton burchellii]
MCIPLAKRRSTAVRGYCGSASPLCDYLSSLLVARHRELAAISERSARRKGERGRSLGVAQKVERKVVSRWHFGVENTLVASEYIRGDYEPSSLYPATCVTDVRNRPNSLTKANAGVEASLNNLGYAGFTLSLTSSMV